MWLGWSDSRQAKQQSEKYAENQANWGSVSQANSWGDIRLIFRLRIDDLSHFRSMLPESTGREEEARRAGRAWHYFPPTIVLSHSL